MMDTAGFETEVRLGVFFGVLALMLFWEWRKPNRHSAIGKQKRWLSNLGLIMLGSVVGRLMLPAGLAAICIYAEQQQLGLWNQLDISVWVSIPITALVLDCLIYWQHRLFHSIPVLWRLHRVHHADPHIDVTTGLRFHPLEIALSLVIKIIAVLTLGAPLLAILIFEVLLNASSMFNHGNIKLPIKLEKTLKKAIVTQAMHRIHHSQVVCETDSNFGFNLSIWDRLFGSYIEEADKGDDNITLGLKEYSSPQTNTSLKALLLMPFKKN